MTTIKPPGFALAALVACAPSSGEGQTGRGETLMQIQQVGSSYHLNQGPVSVEVVPEVGGRIASLKYEGREVLSDPSQSNDNMWGNVLWPSPQSNWGWPPLAVLDHEPYQVEQRDDQLWVTSSVEPDTGYQFVKGYWFDAGSNALVIAYQIHNRSSEARQVAPWEVTRVPPSGLAIFPTGETEFISGMFQPLPTVNKDGLTWYSYDPDVIVGNHKLMTDGAEGWLAYVNQGLALVKQFPDVPAALNVPGEGEIEIYTNQEKTLIEIEQQGPLTHLAPGDSLNWRVQWYLEPLPDGIDAQPGNSALVNWIRSLLADASQ